MGSEEKRFRHGDAAEKLRRNKTASRLINAATILGLLLAVGFAVYGFYTGIFTSEENSGTVYFRFRCHCAFGFHFLNFFLQGISAPCPVRFLEGSHQGSGAD